MGPEEHVKVLWLSAGKPKIPHQIRAAIIRIGPDFMSDMFEIRTKDNAQLRLLLTYKWQFLVNEDDAHLVFSMQDFVGYACSSLCSRIREAAASLTFEEFHNQTVNVIRKALFTKHNDMEGVWFKGIRLFISEVDVQSVNPVNSEINNLL